MIRYIRGERGYAIQHSARLRAQAGADELVLRNRRRKQAVRFLFEVERDPVRQRVIANQGLQPVEVGIEQNQPGVRSAQLTQRIVVILRPAGETGHLAQQNPARDYEVAHHFKPSVPQKEKEVSRIYPMPVSCWRSARRTRINASDPFLLLGELRSGIRNSKSSGLVAAGRHDSGRNSTQRHKMMSARLKVLGGTRSFGHFRWLCVIECNRYVDRKQPSLWDMRQIAWVLDTDSKRQRIGFIRSREWAKHGDEELLPSQFD